MFSAIKEGLHLLDNGKHLTAALQELHAELASCKDQEDEPEL